jgi:hypothetical protein
MQVILVVLLKSHKHASHNNRRNHKDHKDPLLNQTLQATTIFITQNK